jgi:hypothetical protein
MARVPVPKKPKLFKDQKGQFSIHFSSWRSNGAPTLGSLPLNTKDQKEARQLLKEKIDTHEIDALVSAAKARAAAPKPPKSKVKVKVKVKTNGSRKKPAAGESKARIHLRVITAQLHALALQIEQLSEELG